MLLLSLTEDSRISGTIVGIIGGLGIFAGIFGGSIADTINRRQVLKTFVSIAVFCNLLISALVLGIDYSGGKSTLFIYLITALLALEAICLYISNPAHDGSLKSIISPSAYPTAMGAAQARESLLSIVGNPLSGLLYGLNHALPFLLRLVCQSLFLFFFRGIRANLGPGREHNTTGDAHTKTLSSQSLAWLNILAGYRESFRFLVSKPAMLRFILCAPLVNFMVVLYTTWSVFYLRINGYSAIVVGLAVSGFAVGGLLGSSLNSFLASRIPPGWLAIYGLGFMTLAFTFFGLFGKTPLLIFIFATLAMIPSPPLNAGIFTYVFSETSTEMQGRVIATFQTVGGISTIVDPFVAGYASGGNSTVFLITSCIISLCGVLSILLSKDVRSIPKL